MDCTHGIAPLSCHHYGRAGGVLGLLRIKATGPEAQGSRSAVPWRDEHESHLPEPSQRTREGALQDCTNGGPSSHPHSPTHWVQSSSA